MKNEESEERIKGRRYENKKNMSKVSKKNKYVKDE